MESKLQDFKQSLYNYNSKQSMSNEDEQASDVVCFPVVCFVMLTWILWAFFLLTWINLNPSMDK